MAPRGIGFRFIQVNDQDHVFAHLLAIFRPKGGKNYRTYKRFTVDLRADCNAEVILRYKQFFKHAYEISYGELFKAPTLTV